MNITAENLRNALRAQYLTPDLRIEYCPKCSKKAVNEVKICAKQ